MKVIEITSGNQKAQFTTKSMTFNGREFLYANMTDVVNNTELHTYTFRYDGVPKAFPYEEKDAKLLNAIFSQVQGIQAQKKASASGVPETAAPAKAPKTSEKTEEANPAETAKKKISEKQTEAPTSEPEKSTKEPDSEAKQGTKSPTSETEKGTKEPTSETEKNTKELTSETEKNDKKRSVKGIFSSMKKEQAEKQEFPAEGLDADPERHARLKKSFTVFGIILAAVVVVSFIYYFVFGTSSDPTPANPNASKSQQYNDIDELINDLQ